MKNEEKTTIKLLLIHSDAKNPEPCNTRVYVFHPEDEKYCREVMDGLKGYRMLRKVTTTDLTEAIATLEKDFMENVIDILILEMMIKRYLDTE